MMFSIFWDFVLAEQHVKEGHLALAMDAYNQCLRLGGGASELNDWFVNRAGARLRWLQERPPRDPNASS